MNIQEMTITELEELKAKWYSVNMESILCIRGVAEELGTCFVSKYTFQLDDINVYVDNYGRYMTVHVGDKLVCSTHQCEQLFIPGEWVAKILALYGEAMQRRQERMDVTKEKKRLDLVAQLTL